MTERMETKAIATELKALERKRQEGGLEAAETKRHQQLMQTLMERLRSHPGEERDPDGTVLREAESISKILFSVGTGLLIGGGKGKVDIALQVGKVGAMDRNEVEDRIVRVFVGVSGSEIWQRKGVRVP